MNVPVICHKAYRSDQESFDFGNAFLGDGDDDHISFGSYTNLDGKDQVIISFWLNSDAGEIVTFGHSESTSSRFSVLKFSNDLLYLLVGTRNASFDFTPFFGKKVHVVIFYDGSQINESDRVEMYVDDVKQSLSFAGANSIPNAVPSNNNKFYIGRYEIPNPDVFGNSPITEIGIVTDRSLTPQNVSDLYKDGNGAAFNDVFPSAVNYWKFNEPDKSATLEDTMGNNNGTFVNCTTPPAYMIPFV